MSICKYAVHGKVSKIYNILHPRFCDAFIIFKCFIVMHLIRMPLIILLPLKNCQEALKKRLNIVFMWGEHFVVTWWMQMYCCSVWTIQTLSFLISYTIPKMSTTSNFLIPCRILSMAIIVPDRPTPALQWATIGLCSGLTRSLNALTNLKWANYS